MPDVPALVTRLRNATYHRQIEWEQIGPDTFGAQLGSSRVIVKSVDGDGLAPYRLDVISSAGAMSIVGNSNDQDYNGAFRELYEAVASASVDTAAPVREVLSALDELERTRKPLPPF